MKNLLKIALATIALIIGNFANGQVQPVPTELPLTRAAAISYALQNVRGIQGWVSAPSLIYSEGDSFFEYYQPKDGANERDLIAAIEEHVLRFEIVNPEKDWVTVSLRLYDEEWHPLFAATTLSKLEPDDDNEGLWDLPHSATQMKLMLWHELFIKMPHLIGARVVLRDELGGTSTKYLKVDGDWDGEDQHLRIPTYLLGKEGELILDFWNGEQAWTAAYDMADGQKVETTKSATHFHASFHGVQRLLADGPEGIVLQLPQLKRGSDFPLIVTDVTESKLYPVGATLGEDEERPLSVVILNLSNQVQEKYDMESNSTIWVELEPGSYHIYFNWDPEDGLIDLGGKG